MQLIGEIQGHKLIFKEVAPNLFKSDLPNLSGVHYIKLRAIDDAGNVTNEIHSIAILDFENLCFRVVSSDYCIEDITNDFSYKVVSKECGKSPYNEEDFLYKVVDFDIFYKLL